MDEDSEKLKHRAGGGMEFLYLGDFQQLFKGEH